MFINSRIILTLSLVMLGACSAATAPTVQTGPGAEVINGNLHRVDHARTAMAYVDPDVNFDKYSQVMLDPLGADNVEIIKPNTTGSVSQRVRNADWQLSEKNIQALQAAFASAMKTQLEEKGDYTLTDKPGDDVLRISAVLTALAPTATPDDFKSRSAGRGRVYTEGAGTVFISIGFIDSESGEVLALIKDHRSGGNTWGVNNSVSNMADVRQAFNYWARMIRARLDIVHGD